MDIANRFGKLALISLLFALAGCKIKKEEPLSLPVIPPPPPEKVEPKVSCNACSVTCPNPDTRPIIDSSSNSTKEKKELLASRIDEITIIDAHQSYGGRTPSYSKKSSFIVMADFLWWKAEEDGLEYAATMTPLQPPSDLLLGGYPALKEKLIAPGFTWSLGFRAGLGYQFGIHDNWELDLVWTWLYNKAKNSVSNETPQLMYPTWGGLSFVYKRGLSDEQPLITTVSHASSQWNLHYNVIDLELGRHYFVSKAFSLRPCIGARGAIIDQDYILHYTEVYNYTDPLGTFEHHEFPAIMDAKNDFHGIGPRLGLDLQWHLNCHWSILGKLSGSMLYGPFKTHQTYDSFILTLPTTRLGPVYFNAINYVDSKKANRFEANLEASLGVQWEISHFHLGVFYELSEWFRQNRLVRNMPLIAPYGGPVLLNGLVELPDVKEHGNLGLSGFTVKAQVDF